jgi:hypothetical protein
MIWYNVIMYKWIFVYIYNKTGYFDSWKRSTRRRAGVCMRKRRRRQYRQSIKGKKRRIEIVFPFNIFGFYCVFVFYRQFKLDPIPLYASLPFSQQMKVLTLFHYHFFKNYQIPFFV